MNESTVCTGIDGLDIILRGGLPAGNLYLVQGTPGAGKTTLALQFLLAGVAKGEKVLYVALGETMQELDDVARSHGWTLQGMDVCDLHESGPADPDAQYTFFHPSEVELGETTKAILAAIDRVKPRRVVFDSLSEMRLLARESLRYRKQILALKQHLSAIGATVLMLDTGAPVGAEFQLQTVAHGVLTLEQRDPAYGGKRRRLTFDKVRGVPYLDGWHDYVVVTGGLRVYPRLVSNEAPIGVHAEIASTGDAQLDALLHGGIERGSSTLLVGPSGVGKSTLAMQFVRAAIDRRERCVVYLFDETRVAWTNRARALGLGLHDADPSLLHLRPVNPSELTPGEFADQVRSEVRDLGARTVVVDSLNGYNEAMPEERFLSLHMHELLTFLANRGVSTFLVLATSGAATGVEYATLDLSYISDTIIALRYFEAFGEVRKAISVLKRRSGPHETTIRELEITNGAGIRVGEVLRDFRGVLTAAPAYVGPRKELFGDGGG